MQKLYIVYIFSKENFINYKLSPQNTKNRRSLAIMPNNQQGNMRGGKPTMEIYRPPSKFSQF